MVRVTMKYGKWQGTMASGSKIWDVKWRVKSKGNITGGMNVLSKKLEHFWSQGYNELCQVARKYGKWHQDIVQKMKGYN